MKKNLIFTGLLAVSLILTACGNTTSLPQAVEDAVDEVENNQPIADAVEPEAVVEQINTENPTYVTDYGQLDIGDTDMMSTSYYIIKIDSDEYSNLRDAVDSYFDQFIEARTQRAKELLAKVDEPIDDFPSAHYIVYNSFDVKCADSNIFSILIFSQEYVNLYGNGDFDSKILGAEYTTVNFDSRTGKIITIDDLGDVCPDLSNGVGDLNDFADINALKSNAQAIVAEKVSSQKCDAPFYIDGRGLNLVFSQDELNKEPNDAYYMSPYVLNITFDEMPSYNPRYIPSVQDYHFPISNACHDTLVDVNNDGIKEKLSLITVLDEYEWPEYASIYIGDKEFPADAPGTDFIAEGYNAYYYNVDGKGYIYVDRVFSNDWAEIVLYALNGDDLEFCFQNSGSIEAFSKEGITIGTRINKLGTWGVRKYYIFDENGKIVEKDNLYYTDKSYDPDSVTDMDSWKSITTAIEISDRNGNKIPVGTNLFPVCMDDDLYIMFQDENHNKYEFDLTQAEPYWGYCIDGINEEEIFESLPYVG